MIISPNKNKNLFYTRFRTPSAINAHPIRINKLTKNLSSPRITSAINTPLNNNNNNNLSFNPNLLIKPNSTYRNLNINNIKNSKKSNTIDTTLTSNNYSLNSFLNSPVNIKTTQKPISKLYIKKNKKLFDNFFMRNKEKYYEENKKIQSVLSELMSWDNKQLIENNEIFKEAKTFCEKEKEKLKSQKDFSEKNQYFHENKTGWFFTDDRNKKNFELKFSVFDKNYKKCDINKNKNEENKNKEKLFDNNIFENKLKKVNLKDTILEIQKENSKVENINKEQLIKIYKYIISNKLKKRKYKEIIESTYYLLNQARNECKLSVDLLKERIKSVQKYYEAYIESMNKLNKINESERRKLNYMEKYEEKVKKYREYLTIFEEINKEIKGYEDKYNIIKVDLESFIKEINIKIEKINNEINKYIYLYNELKDQQIEYYLEKLKKGVDTRSEGLSWIVKKLMEFKTKIEPNLFPRFLDQEQINYIIQISKLGFECNQLKQITKTLRDKNTDLINKKSDKNTIKKKKILLNEIKDNGLVEDINFDIDFSECFEELIKEKGEINQKITELQEKFSKNEGISPAIKYKIENKKLNMITQKIKNKLNIYANTRDNKLFESEEKNRDNIIKYIFKEGKEKEYLQDLFLLNDRAKRLDEIIYNLKKEEYLIFVEKMKLYEAKEKFSKKYYGKVFNALFGNTIFEITSKCNLNLSGV